LSPGGQVLAWKLDRWGYSQSDLITTLQELEALGAGLVSVSKALDFTTPLGCAMLGMLATFAEFERSLLQERIKAGISHARSKSKPFGRPKIPKNVHRQIKGLAADGASK
jgi:DNA invertase Pin-like site-specific DNA recombinase